MGRHPVGSPVDGGFGRGFVAELIGTALLLVAIVGSGIMGERLAGDNVAVALLANSVATGAALAVLIVTFAPVSGAHFNPVVSFVMAAQGHLSRVLAIRYAVAHVCGALVGVAVANVMFGESVFAVATRERAGLPLALSEIVATFGLLTVILGCARARPALVPAAVGAYITAAFWFTPSTSFANPAVTIARTLTDTFSGIRPADVPGFLIAQVIGGAAALSLWRWLVPATHPRRATPALRAVTAVE